MSKFLSDLLERVVSSAAGAALATITATAASDARVVNWGLVAGVSALAAVVSALKGVAASRVGDPNSASLVQ